MVSVQRYVDILSNGGFKALFGDRNNKDVVISILNALLPSDRKVEDIEYMPTEYSGQTQENKDYRSDGCRGQSSRQGAVARPLHLGVHVP